MKQYFFSPDFTLGDLIISSTARSMGVGNYPPRSARMALRHLCASVLQPLRDYYGHPIAVIAGYRSRVVNKAEGRRKDSQHMRGEAADLMFPDIDTAHRWVDFIRTHCVFDQMLLLPCDSGSDVHCLHVSCCIDEKRNRRVYRELSADTCADNF